MRKALTLLLISVFVLSSLVMVGSVFAQSVTKPSVPEFTIKIVSAPYDVPATHSIDPYTGKEIINPGYHVENETTQIWIKNQPFTPYQTDVDLYYNIRIKGSFSQDWFYYRYHNGSSDGNLRHNSDSDYTVRVIDSYLPSEGQIDIQVQALIGYEHGISSVAGIPVTPRIITGESSGWSEIQTLTIGESQTPSPEPSSTPEPTSTPYNEPTGQVLILGLAAIFAVFVFGLVLLYRIKRK
jgi:hypothetical protein